MPLMFGRSGTRPTRLSAFTCSGPFSGPITGLLFSANPQRNSLVTLGENMCVSEIVAPRDASADRGQIAFIRAVIEALERIAAEDRIAVRDFVIQARHEIRRRVV